MEKRLGVAGSARPNSIVMTEFTFAFTHDATICVEPLQPHHTQSFCPAALLNLIPIERTRAVFQLPHSTSNRANISPVCWRPPLPPSSISPSQSKARFPSPRRPSPPLPSNRPLARPIRLLHPQCSHPRIPRHPQLRRSLPPRYVLRRAQATPRLPAIRRPQSIPWTVAQNAGYLWHE